MDGVLGYVLKTPSILDSTRLIRRGCEQQFQSYLLKTHRDLLLIIAWDGSCGCLPLGSTRFLCTLTSEGPRVQPSVRKPTTSVLPSVCKPTTPEVAVPSHTALLITVQVLLKLIIFFCRTTRSASSLSSILPFSDLDFIVTINDGKT